MRRFDDEELQQICATRFAQGVPEHVSVAAHERARILIAAKTLQDVRIMGPILRWPKIPARYGLHIDGKWHVTYSWSEDFGAYEIRLERRQEGSDDAG
jgi:plasmid maintenance system killer protein